MGLGQCAQCGDYLGGSSVLVAGASLHPECFTCLDCRGPIIGQFYILEGGGSVSVSWSVCHVHHVCHVRWRCGDCWRLAQPRCQACGLPILDQLVTALDAAFHAVCFTCGLCSARLDTGGHFMQDEETGAICRECFVK